MKPMFSIVIEEVTGGFCAAHEDSRAIIARYMDARAARTALHVHRVHRMFVKVEIRLLSAVETLWAKQGLRLLRTAIRLFPVSERVESKRDALKMLARSLKFLEFHQFFLKYSLVLDYLRVSLEERHRDILKSYMLVLKLHQLVPRGFDGTVDELLAFRLSGGRKVADIFDDFRRGLDEAEPVLRNSYYRSDVELHASASPVGLLQPTVGEQPADENGGRA